MTRPAAAPPQPPMPPMPPHRDRPREPHPHPPMPWRQAWAEAAQTFYGSPTGRPDLHFATAVNDGDAMARLVMAHLADLDDALGRPPRLALVDVGCGDAGLLTEVLARLDAPLAQLRGWRDRLDLVGVDLRERPAGLDPRVDWVRGAAADAVPTDVVGLVWAHELLDDVPCDVVAVDDDCVVREVLVDGAGREEPGGAVDADDPRSPWLQRWWPLREPGDRAEVGASRDALWSALATSLHRGAAVAVDYSHDRAARSQGRVRGGTLTGYRHGRVVTPVPDGSCNLTAHVALDACAGATTMRTGDELRLTTVRDVAGTVPGDQLAGTEARPAGPAARLAAASRWRTLRDPSGVGAFGWLELRRVD